MSVTKPTENLKLDRSKSTVFVYSTRNQEAFSPPKPILLLNRARDLIVHDPAHRGANGAAMPTDEDDQDGHFFFNHPERGDYPAA